MSKSVICRKCGQNDLFWRKSANGNFYLAEPDYIQFGERQNKSIPFAHKCAITTNSPKSFNEVKVTELKSLIANMEKALNSTNEEILRNSLIESIERYNKEIKALSD